MLIDFSQTGINVNEEVQNALSLAKAPKQKWNCTLTKSWRHPFWGERFSCKMLTLIDFLKLEQMWTNRWGRSGDTSSWVARFNCEKSFSNLPSDLLLLLLLPSLSPHQTFTFSSPPPPTMTEEDNNFSTWPLVTMKKQVCCSRQSCI